MKIWWLWHDMETITTATHFWYIPVQSMVYLVYRTLQIAFFTHNNITCERCIEVAILVCGWCQAITSKSKYQIRVFPLCFPNIPYLFNIVYILYGCLPGNNGMFSPMPVNNPGPLFTKRTDVLPPNIVKSRSREIDCYHDRIVLKFDRHLGSAAADMPVKFQSDWNSLNPNLAASRLHEILR